MGVHVILDIDPTGIDSDAWAVAYADTLALLEAWPGPLVGWGSRVIEGQRISLYARSLRHEDGDPSKDYWSVTGDAGSFKMAECQSLHRSLGADPRRGTEPALDDIVTVAGRPDRGG